MSLYVIYGDTGFVFVSYPTVGILSATHALQHSLVEPQLQTGLVKHLPLVAVPGDQAVDLDRLGLADTVTPCLGLVEEGHTRSETLTPCL